MHRHVSALILAGGKATRFGGVAKHELVVDGQTIFARQVSVLEPHVAEILVSAPRDIAGYRTVRDAALGIGPLAGIAAGLAACRTKWLLVVAGDMPYITRGLIELFILCASYHPTVHSSVRERLPFHPDRIDAIGIRIDSLPEPLVCLLRRDVVLPIVERRIAAGDYKASRLLTDDDLRVHWLEGEDRAAVRNVNSPEDLGP